MSQDFSLKDLNAFIVKAKAATYVGDGEKAESCRPGSHDLIFEKAPFFYLDSYFGGSDFIGQEVVYYKGKSVWAMNYYGHILAPDLITAADAGKMIKESLSKMYAEAGRFLGGFEHAAGDFAIHRYQPGRGFIVYGKRVDRSRQREGVRTRLSWWPDQRLTTGHRIRQEEMETHD